MKLRTTVWLFAGGVTLLVLAALGIYFFGSKTTLQNGAIISVAGLLLFISQQAEKAAKRSKEEGERARKSWEAEKKRQELADAATQAEADRAAASGRVDWNKTSSADIPRLRDDQ